MISHFLSRSNVSRHWKTTILLVLAVLFITFSLIGKGLNGSPLIVAMYFTGFVLFFYAVLLPWRKASYYFILSMAFILLFILLWLVGIYILSKLQLHDKLGEDIAWSVGLACVAGVIAGMIGIFTFASGWQRLPYAAAALSLLAVVIMISPSMSPPPMIKISTLIGERMWLGLQLFITVLFFSIGHMNRIDNRLTKAALVITAIVLVLTGLWGFFVTAAEPGKDMQLSFWKLTIRICAIVDIIIAFIAFYGFLKTQKPDQV